MPPTYFPLRWESTGDQWWYASPIDWAAANGHYDLVRLLLRIDSNHLIKLTSLPRIRRLETVWDDEEQFNDVSKCRSQVAQKLFLEGESKKGKMSLITARYGGWLMYTAAAAGDLGFVQALLERNPLLVFGEGEYGVTDILYAAAKSKNCEVFRLLFDFALSPRFQTEKNGGWEEKIGETPCVYKWEMMNRGVHAAARGGNVKILEELLANCSDVLAYRDAIGSTVLHAAAGRGQVEVIKYLTSSYDIIDSTDHQGNTALHIAAYRGQLAAVEAIVSAFPSLISLRNNARETFLHKAVSGFRTSAFRRLDRQVELMKQLISGNNFHIEDIINVQNKDGRTALHMAIIGNVHSDLVQLLMMARSIDVNVCDIHGMTSLDYLRQRPSSSSSDILIRQLISAGGIFHCEDYSARRAIASHLKMQGNGSSPGSSFRISDAEIFLYTGVQNGLDAVAYQDGAEMSSSSSGQKPYDTANDNHSATSSSRRPSSVTCAAEKLKRALQWPKIREKKVKGFNKSIDEGSTESYKKWSSSDEALAPLRQRFLKHSSQPNNKRPLSVRSNQSSPVAKKKLASSIMGGAIQSMSHITIPARSRSNSFSKLSVSSLNSSIKLKGVYIDAGVAGPSCSNQTTEGETSNVTKQEAMIKKLPSHYFCFGAAGLSVKNSITKQHQNQRLEQTVLPMA